MISRRNGINRKNFKSVIGTYKINFKDFQPLETIQKLKR